MIVFFFMLETTLNIQNWIFKYKKRLLFSQYVTFHADSVYYLEYMILWNMYTLLLTEIISVL